MGWYQNSQYLCWPTEEADIKNMLIFGISRLKTAATNNVLLVSVGKPINIDID
jgi:hypothetical protein